MESVLREEPTRCGNPPSGETSAPPTG
jgi:hypothetical protein